MTEPLLLLPNVPALATAFLRAQPEVSAIVETRVVTEFAKQQVFPAVRVTQFTDEPTIPRPLVHTRSTLQVEAYGGPKNLAWLLAETCRAAFAARFNGSLSFDVDTHTVSGRVSGCDLSGLRDLPDPEFSPAKPRWLFTLAVYARASRS